MKKVLLISLINVIALVTVLAFVRSELGTALSLKIFIPVTILFATNLATTLTVISKE